MKYLCLYLALVYTLFAAASVEGRGSGLIRGGGGIRGGGIRGGGLPRPNARGGAASGASVRSLVRPSHVRLTTSQLNRIGANLSRASGGMVATPSGSSLMLRAAPRVSSHIISRLPDGATFSILRRGGSWLKVRTGAGREGWVCWRQADRLYVQERGLERTKIPYGSPSDDDRRRDR